MDDVSQLRDVMLAALAGAALGLACAPTPEPPERDRPPEPSCAYAAWCGTPAEATAIAEGTARTDACPTKVKLPAGTKTIDGNEVGTQPEIADLRPLEEMRQSVTAPADPAQSCCYEYEVGCMGGRPLLDAGRPVVAEAVLGTGWADAPRPRPLADPVLRAALADAWIADAQAEHASVASFARATLELMAVAAPAALLADVQAAALDEVRHARRCFGLAQEYGARAMKPGPLPPAAPRVLDLAGVARVTFIEACVGETAAALVATRAAAACTDPVVAAVLREIAADETRHAALGWRIVAWAHRTGGPAVAAELQAAGAAMDEGRIGQSVPTDLFDRPDLGRLGADAIRQTMHDAWRGIGRPALSRLLA